MFSSSRPWLTALPFATLLVGLASPAAHAQTFTFTDIANSTSTEFQSFRGDATVNHDGTVAFYATRDAGGFGIYTATGTGAFTTVARDTSPEFASLSNNPSINNAGLVAFQAGRDAGGQGIYTATDSNSFNTIAVTSTGVGGFRSLGDARIGATGQLTFAAERDGGDGNGTQAVYRGTSAGDLNQIASDKDGQFSYFVNPSISSDGAIAFYATSPYGGQGIYRTDAAGQLFTVATPDRPEFSQFGTPAINNSGLTTFFSYDYYGQSGIYTAILQGANVTTIANTYGQFRGLTEPDINNRGTVAFVANTNTGFGLYAKLSSASDPVALIRAGDPLFGSTLNYVSFYRGLADDTDTLAFHYDLTNGVSGVGRVTINGVTSAAAPEPSALALLIPVLPLVSGVVRRRRNA